MPSCKLPLPVTTDADDASHTYFEGKWIKDHWADEAGCMKICDEEYREAEKKCDPLGNFKNSKNK